MSGKRGGISAARLMGMTGREYKAAFRRRIRGLIRLHDEYRIGSASLPGAAYRDYLEVEKILHRIAEAISAKEWGR